MRKKKQGDHLGLPVPDRGDHHRRGMGELRAGGTYWSWDPKETWSLIVWLVYAAFLHSRITRGWYGKHAAFLSITGFATTVFRNLGVNLVLSGLHSYRG